MRLHDVTSCIVNADQEKEVAFRTQEYKERKNFQLFALTCGLFIYSSFGFLDVIVGGAETTTLITLRFAVALPLLMVLTALFARTTHYIAARNILSLYMLIAGGSIAGMIAATSGMLQFCYPIGVMVVICFGAGFCGQDFRQGLVVNISLVVATWIGLGFSGAPLWIMASSLAFLVAAVLIMAVASATNEMLARARFAALQEAREASSRAIDLYRTSLESNHAMGQFLATVSHELRTPLNAIIGFAEVIDLQIFGPVGDERYVGYVKDIQHSGRHLARLIEDIIDYSKAGFGEMRLESAEYPLRRSVEDAIRMCEGLNERRKHTLDFDRRPGEIDIMHVGDETRIRQAVINVIGNAIKFTQTGGRIGVRVGIDPAGNAFIDVTDNGPGIPPEALERIRQPFARVDDAYRTETQGLGLGLSIVEKIMDVHGGTLNIDSTLGQGCRIRLRLPAQHISVPSDVQEFSRAS